MGGPAFDTQSLALKLKQRRFGLLQNRLDEASQFNPDTIAPNAELASKGNFDLQFVEKNSEKVKEFLEFQQFSPEQASVLQEKYPDLSLRIMQDPNFGPVMHDEIDVIGQAEGIFSDIRKGGALAIKNLEVTKEGFNVWMKALNGQTITDEDRDILRLKLEDAGSIELPERSFLAEIPGVVSEQSVNLALFLTGRLAGQAGGAAIGAALGSEGGPITAAGGAAAGATIGTFIAGGSIEAAQFMATNLTRTDDQGNLLDQDQVLVGGNAVFFINGALETFAFKKLLDTLPKGVSPTKHINKSVSRIFNDQKLFTKVSETLDELRGGKAGAIFRLFELIFTEATTEGAQELSSEVNAKIAEALDDEAFVDSSLRDLIEGQFWNETLPKMGEATKTGAQLALGTGGVGTTASIAKDVITSRGRIVPPTEEEVLLLPAPDPGEVANDVDPEIVSDVDALRQTGDESLESQEDQRIIDELESLVAQAKLTERSPDMMASHLQNVAGEGNNL